MTTASQAYEIIKARLSEGATIPLRWQNEDNLPLPGKPAPFAYIEFLAEGALLAAFGGGRGANRYRNPARVDVYVFVPSGAGLTPATDLAEGFAARLRSYRDADISCFEASVFPGGAGADIKPPGLRSEVGNYFWACAEISLFFDQIG